MGCLDINWNVVSDASDSLRTHFSDIAISQHTEVGNCLYLYPKETYLELTPRDLRLMARGLLELADYIEYGE